MYDKTDPRAALEAEFAACPEARDYQRTQAPLVILGAAYTGAPARVEFDRDVQVLAGSHLAITILPTQAPSSDG